jgi:hypothetical protein
VVLGLVHVAAHCHHSACRGRRDVLAGESADVDIHGSLFDGSSDWHALSGDIDDLLGF